MKTVIAQSFDVIKTQRLIDRILEVPNFENVAYVCKDFQDFCFEVAEWGVDHAAGVDFDDPTLDIAMLNDAIAGHGYAPEDCL